MSIYDEVKSLVETARMGKKNEQNQVLARLTLLDKPLDKQAQKFLESTFLEVGRDKGGDASLFRSVTIALAKYGDLQTLSVTELLWPRLIKWIEEVAVNPKSGRDQADIWDILSSEAVAGLSRFDQYKTEVTGELIRIIALPKQRAMIERFSEIQKQVYMGLSDDILIAIGSLGDDSGVDFLKRWMDSGNVAAKVALEHFGEPYDIIRMARIDLEEKTECPACPICNSKMTLRTAKKSPNAGKKFYVCDNYPECRGKVAYEDVCDDEWTEERPAKQTKRATETKSKVTYGVLALLIGGLGIHRFYLGQSIGILYILFCWTYIPSLIAFVEGIIALCSSDESWERKLG
jgi:hypothetical protein